MKKMVTTFLLVVGLFCTPTHCTHEHDEHCGYDPKTNTGCTHECVYLGIEQKNRYQPER